MLFPLSAKTSGKPNISNQLTICMAGSSGRR